MCRLCRAGRGCLDSFSYLVDCVNREEEPTDRVKLPICIRRIIHCANPETSLTINCAVIGTHERLIVFSDLGLVPEALDVFVFTAVAFCNANAMFTAKQE